MKYEIARLCYEHITSGCNKKYVTVGVLQHGGARHWASIIITKRVHCPMKFIAKPFIDSPPWIDGDIVHRKSKQIVGYIKTWQGDDNGNMPPIYFGAFESIDCENNVYTVKLSD